MIVLGLLLGMIGMDVNSGVARYAFGVTQLYDGINLVPLAMGLFAFSEILANLEHSAKREVFTNKVSGFWLTRQEVREALPAILRGTFLGSGLGLLPGGGAVLASFAAYTVEKKLSRTPEKFGHGRYRRRRGPGIGEQRRGA